MATDPEIISPGELLPEKEVPTVTFNLFAAMQDLMKQEGPGMMQYGGESEYEYFRGWGSKWRALQKDKEEGLF